MKNNLKTLVITNFDGRLTRREDGDINSGLAKYNTTFGADPFSIPGNLTWLTNKRYIGGVISDCIMAARPRLESGITYVYAIGHTGRLYKIQVNNPSTQSPNYNNPVLLTTIGLNSPTFKYGSSIQFYGATEKIFIGHDKGVTKVNFDGNSEYYIGTLGSYTIDVPRPSANFLGKLYFGNGNNLVEIDSTELVTSYAKLSPGFPTNTYTRDIDVSPDGNYLQVIVSGLNSPDLTASTQDTNSLASTNSYKFMWNGTDAGYTSYESYNGYTINANTSFGPFNYIMGYDLNGIAVYSNGQKLVSLPNSTSPNFGAVFSSGNMLGFGSPDYDFTTGKLTGSIIFYGQYDEEVPKGLFRFLKTPALTPATDIIQMPVCLAVSNLFYGSSTAGYTDNQVGLSTLYFSTVETNSTTTYYRFCSIELVRQDPNSESNLVDDYVYETQNQLFSKKVKATEVRLYLEPILTGVEFTLDLIGSDGDPISGGSKTFIEGSNLTVGQDYVWYTPSIKPTYCLGLRLSTIDGSTNWVAMKAEIDYTEAGQ